MRPFRTLNIYIRCARFVKEFFSDPFKPQSRNGSLTHQSNLFINYRNNTKYWDTLSTYHTGPKIWNSPF